MRKPLSLSLEIWVRLRVRPGIHLLALSRVLPGSHLLVLSRVRGLSHSLRMGGQMRHRWLLLRVGHW